MELDMTVRPYEVELDPYLEGEVESKLRLLTLFPADARLRTPDEALLVSLGAEAETLSTRQRNLLCSLPTATRLALLLTSAPLYQQLNVARLVYLLSRASSDDGCTVLPPELLDALYSVVDNSSWCVQDVLRLLQLLSSLVRT